MCKPMSDKDMKTGGISCVDDMTSLFQRQSIRSACRCTKTAPESAVPQSCVVLGLHERLYAARRQAACLQPDRRIHRECHRIDADRAIRATDVLEILAEAIRQHGTPQYIRSDNGPEFIAKAIQQWLAEHQIKTIYIDPGCPWQNGYAESFNSRFGLNAWIASCSIPSAKPAMCLICGANTTTKPVRTDP